MIVSKKAQVAVEYLFILALALAIIIPGSVLFLNYSQESNEKIINSQINQIGDNIIDQAENIFTIGKESWITLEISIPEKVTKMYIIDDELVIEYNTKSGITEAVFFSGVPIQGGFGGNITNNLHFGYMSVKIESLGTNVSIYEESN